MNLTLPEHQQRQLLEELETYLNGELDADAGDLKVELFYEFLENHFGRMFYNKAIEDSRRFLKEKFDDLDIEMDRLIQ